MAKVLKQKTGQYNNNPLIVQFGPGIFYDNLLMLILGQIQSMCKAVLLFSPLFLFFSCAQQDKKNGSNINSKTIDMYERFRPPEWVHSTNIYEVNLRQYTPAGTFNAFAQELYRLKEMGVKTLWFMPVTPISGKNRKGTLGSYYACSDYTAVNPEFGTLDDFKNLVAQAHEMGFTVLLDWVANHTGWDHVWTKEHPAFYLKDSATNDFRIASGMDDIIELDFSNPDMRRAMTDAMKFWVTECGIDGFRCDLAFWVELDFWWDVRKELDDLRPLFWFGEYDAMENPEYDEVFDASYTWTWMHRAKDFYSKQSSPDSLQLILKNYDDLGDSSIRVWFTSNHDENSWNGTEYEKYGDMAKALAVFSCTWNGIPLLYSGQELPNKKRLKFFEKDTIAWTETPALHDFYKTLLHLKTTHPALRAGDASVQSFLLETTAPGQVFAFLRKKGEKEVLVILNLSAEKNLRFDLTGSKVSGMFQNVFSGAENDFTSEKTFEMQPWEFLVYRK